MNNTTESANGRLVVRSVVFVVFLTAVSLTLGFIILPGSQGDLSASMIWASICRAAGVPGRRTADTSAAVLAAHGTTVVFDRTMVAAPSSDAVGRGATLALQCNVCHGAEGSTLPNAPSLAGQFQEVIVKQLIDFQHGDRLSAVMQATTRDLPRRDIVDLAAYYASSTRPTTAAVVPRSSPPALVSVGEPMRNIAPCAACHGGMDHKVGAPSLDGLPAAYLSTQLVAFASGIRTNDSHAQMRNMARMLTSKEVTELAAYYATRNTSAGSQNR